MTVIDTIITCALYMWYVLSWIVSSTWHCWEIVHAFYVEQPGPSSVQIALFIGFVLIAWLLFVLGNGFHNKFMAVPKNERAGRSSECYVRSWQPWLPPWTTLKGRVATN